ncbi:hypothetical protein Scep_028261 [Stephania cephalantha]|uniref:Pentatricopeptide repeat-containing protein n=1 Tax=Stephania cephalantha TaxID=152367 RepID=A0AAP0E9L2_9MAGN
MAGMSQVEFTMKYNMRLSYIQYKGKKRKVDTGDQLATKDPVDLDSRIDYGVLECILEIFGEMNENGCLPDIATFNSLIKHLCKIRRMEKVHELLDKMENTKGHYTPNPSTYSYLLKSLKKPNEVPVLLGRTKKNGCVVTPYIYNLILKLFMDWNDEEGFSSIWYKMERNGLGPYQRSYTIVVHGLHNKGKMEEALQYFLRDDVKGIDTRTTYQIVRQSH